MRTKTIGRLLILHSKTKTVFRISTNSLRNDATVGLNRSERDLVLLPNS